MKKSLFFSETASFIDDRRILALFILFALLIRIVCLGLNDLLVEEAYYWNYAAHMDWSYLDHPPMVAVLIKCSVLIFGTNEWAVRIPSILCWGIAAFYSYRLSRLIAGQGLPAVFLLSILPFFFLQSWVMTPDQPLLAAWSAALYFAYRACVQQQKRYWYALGAALGLGLLSKYTIVLLGPCLLLYLAMVPEARFWFFRKEPYLAVLIVSLLFLPVLYWNATHEWISFTFQSTRRFHEDYQFSVHQWLGLLLLFLMPWGVKGLFTLKESNPIIDHATKRFLQIFTYVPLLFFGIFSFTHPVKFNWIGPGLLALIPWLVFEFKLHTKHWLRLGFILMCGYLCLITFIIQGKPENIHRQILSKYVDWEDFSQQIFSIASKFEKESHIKPIIVALDKYNIASELSFYQTKLRLQPHYSIQGSHIFGGESLMYKYWSISENWANQYLLLISDNIRHFENPAIDEKTTHKTPIQSFFVRSPGSHYSIRPYYYQMVRAY